MQSDLISSPVIGDLFVLSCLKDLFHFLLNIFECFLLVNFLSIGFGYKITVIFGFDLKSGRFIFTVHD